MRLELTLFNFAIGNGDAHLKNFSLLTDAKGTIAISPAYDLVSSRLVIPSEGDELAITLRGKKKRLKRSDFLDFSNYCNIAPKYAERKILDLLALEETFLEMIDTSELSKHLQAKLKELLMARLERLNTA